MITRNAYRICLFILLLIFSVSSIMLASDNQDVPVVNKIPKLQSILKDLSETWEKGEMSRVNSLVSPQHVVIRDNKIRVMLELKTGVTLDESQLLSYDVEVERKHETFWRVLAPIQALRQLAADMDAIAYIHTPLKAHPEALSEGVSLTGASDWHTAGFKGDGAMVAVIDYGYEGLSGAIAAKDIPDHLSNNDYRVNFTGLGFETGGAHGTAVAEIVYDMAPECKLILIKIDDISDLTLAKNWCISNGVHIINTSLGYYNQGGYDGTGPLCDIVNDAYNHGILWVKSAGNNGQRHYRSNFSDPDNDTWHNFSSSNENNTLSNIWRSDGKIDKDAEIAIYLSWGWPTDSHDYDLYLYNNSGLVASSTNPQTGSEPPTEEIVVDAPQEDTYWIKVKKVSGSGIKSLTIFSPGYKLTYRHAAGSLSQPGDATGCFAVGMIRRENWTVGPVDVYSSRGPTYDGRLKPELVAPSNVTTYSYPAGMYWTSAAAPHAAGAAALVVGAYPSYTVNQVWSYLETNAIDMGTAGKDNDYGAGRLNFPDPPGAGLNPPTDLVALGGYHRAIPLAWNAPAGTNALNNVTSQNEDQHIHFIHSSIIVQSSDSKDLFEKEPLKMTFHGNSKTTSLLGYNVYRSTSISGSYSRIAERISHQYYRDENTTNGQLYYYKVTAVYSDGESNYSNWAEARSETNGYTIKSPWANATPTIDGKIGSDEWATAMVADINYPRSSGTVNLYVMNNQNKLFLAVDDKRDTNLKDRDQFAIVFDENKNREWPSSSPSGEGFIWIAWNADDNTSFSLFGGRSGTWPDKLHLDDNIPSTGVSHGISSSARNVQYEGSIDLNTSQLNATPGDAIGILFFTYDKDTYWFNGFWPQAVVELAAITPNEFSWGTGPFSFGDLVLAASASIPDISVTPSSWNFGEVATGSYAEKIFVVKNDGNSQLNVSSTTITGTSSDFFIASGGGAFNLAPGATQNLIVRFSPTSAGSKSTTLNIYSNDPDENPFIVSLSGSAVQTPILFVTPTTLDFGTSRTNLNFQISNTGGGNLSWNVVENPEKPWIISVLPGNGINAAAVTVTVDRTQLSGIADTGTLVVNSNGGNQNITVLISKEEGSLPEHWNFTANTGNSANIILPTSANPNIDGVPLANGDYIGAFSPEGLCCGRNRWTGQSIALTVWGDNDQTAGIVDGFRHGELIHYRVYRLSAQKEWSSVEVGYSQGDGLYSVNGYLVLNKFIVSDLRTMSLNLLQGWNMFSMNVEPIDLNIAAIMSDIADKLVIVKNVNGQAYIPAYGINDIGNIDIEEGYQAYLRQAAMLEVTGQPAAPTTPINLPAGWSIISYLPTSPMNAEIALSSITDKLVIAKNNLGQAYIPRFGINDIGNMEPGQGYQVYLNAAATLVYPAGSRLTKANMMTGDNSQQTSTIDIEHFQIVAKTGENATIVFPSDINPSYPDGTSFEMGDEVAILNNDGICCGAIAWDGHNKAITAWGNNSQTDINDGMQPGEHFNFRIWRKSVAVEYSVTVKFKEDHSDTYETNGFSVITEFETCQQLVAGEMSAQHVPTGFKLYQNYPNPFNPRTAIEFYLPHEAEVNLSIYDLKGNEVRHLLNGKKSAGNHVIQWSSCDDSGKLVASGIYFYRIDISPVDIKSRSYSETKKMILMK